MWKTRGGLAGRSDRVCENAHVAKRQHAKCQTHKTIGRWAEIALTNRNMGILATSIWHTMAYEICGGARRIACCRSSTWGLARRSACRGGWEAAGRGRKGQHAGAQPFGFAQGSRYVCALLGAWSQARSLRRADTQVRPHGGGAIVDGASLPREPSRGGLEPAGGGPRRLGGGLAVPGSQAGSLCHLPCGEVVRS